MNTRTIFLSAGGTGGHLFPAEALAFELKSRDWQIHLATDKRAQRFTDNFPADQIHIIRSSTFVSKMPLAITRTILELYRGYVEARRLFTKYQPDVVVGFGGYPTLPPLYAAKRAGIPSLLQEQNAVLGRTNRLLSSGAKAIAVGFPQLSGKSRFASKIIVTGNPLRPPVLVAAKKPYIPAAVGEEFNLLIFGGSQGARFFSQVLPKALDLMTKQQRQRLKIVQQARPEDQDSLVEHYAKLDIAAEISPFFEHMPDRIADAHLVICRAGASSVAELTAIGRPSILVPLPHSLDGDQAANGADLAAKDGATIIRQSELSAKKLCDLLLDAMNNPENLATIANNAKKAAIADAARRLADLVEHVALGGTPDSFKEQSK